MFDDGDEEPDETPAGMSTSGGGLMTEDGEMMDHHQLDHGLDSSIEGHDTDHLITMSAPGETTEEDEANDDDGEDDKKDENLVATVAQITEMQKNEQDLNFDVPTKEEPMSMDEEAGVQGVPEETEDDQQMAAELLQQMQQNKAPVNNSGTGLLDALAQVAALQKVVQVSQPQQPQTVLVKKEKTPQTTMTTVVSQRGAGLVGTKKNGEDENSSSNTNSSNSSSNNKGNNNAASKWYTVGMIQGLTHTVTHYYDWSCDETVANWSRRRRQSKDPHTDEEKKRRIEDKGARNGGGGDENTDSDSDDYETNPGVAMYNNQPLTLDNLPNFTEMAGMRRIALEPGTGYRFRIAALNHCGRGEWSEVNIYMNMNKLL